VIILFDSITRLGRAYNTVMPSSGKVLTGGVDANALQRPKRFFGAARNIEEGGSLTIIATCADRYRQPHGRSDFRRVQGHRQHAKCILDRKIADKRVFPAINVRRSGTRREDLLLADDDLQRMWILRKLLTTMEDVPATEFILDKLKDTKTNDEFFQSMKRK
jgi:transcription termination factor Rho